ncbi:MAG: HD domain-containing protein [Pirellula sp.]|jgi:(p)ppGpp synthase/HD superfamily hydrolase
MLFRQEDAQAIENALGLAVRMHQGQRDADGAPYILHLVRVMMRCKDPHAKQAAVLHDILEDTSATSEDLLANGISPEVVQTVERLTHLPGVSYGHYIESLSSDPIAVEVKLADLEDNYSIARVKYREDHRAHDASRLERYILTHRFLIGDLELDQYRSLIGQIKR